MTTLTDKQKAECLAYDPYAGDFGDPGDKKLRDKIVKARKSGDCNICGEQIVPGTEIRSLTEVFDGELGTTRFCHECCKAMALSSEDAGEAIEKRTAMHPNMRHLSDLPD